MYFRRGVQGGAFFRRGNMNFEKKESELLGCYLKKRETMSAGGGWKVTSSRTKPSQACLQERGDYESKD